MNILQYLPSTQFGVIVGSILISGGLVVGAQYITKQPQTTLAVTPSEKTDADWQQELDIIQASAGITLPETPSPQTVESILEGTKSDNLTETLARSLFITLTDAKARGLGDDIPTQESLVVQALDQAGTRPVVIAYSTADLATVSQTPESLRAYGNATMEIFAQYPGANAATVLMAVGYAIDYNDKSRLGALSVAKREYNALAAELADAEVPSTISPLHLQVINNLSAMASAAADMETVLTDPVRGLSGVQRFYSLGREAQRVLTTIAGTFTRNGILFSKDEPGSAWAAFLSAQTQ